MILHIFECSGCQRQQKHVTPIPLRLSYMSECATCNQMRTYKFVGEGNRKEDWYSNILRQVDRKQKEKPKPYTNKRKTDRTKDDQVDRVAINYSA